MNKKIAIIVPIYNESVNIEYVYNDLHALDDITIVFVNDKSTDNSKEKIQQCSNAVLLDLESNIGVGGAVQTGLKYAKREGYDYAVKFDGDGQHRACDIANLLKPIYEKEADIVIGSRFIEKNKGFQSTFTRRLGIKTLQTLSYAITNKKLFDITSGLRAYNRSAIEFFADNYPSFDYPEPEEIIISLKKDFRLLEVPVLMRERHGGVSSITPLVSVYYMIKVILSVIITAIGPRSLSKNDS